MPDGRALEMIDLANGILHGPGKFLTAVQAAKFSGPERDGGAGMALEECGDLRHGNTGVNGEDIYCGFPIC